jgi:hypothetical protein
MSKRTLIAAMLALGLGAGVAAQSSPISQSQPSLQDRVDALSQQITFRYQHYAPALASRRAAAEEVLAAWNKVAPLGDPQGSDENAARLADWLDAALRAVMPGGSGEFPPAPEFVAPVVTSPEAQPPEEVVPTGPPGSADPTDGTPAPESEAAPATRQPTRQSRLKVIDPVTTIENPYVDDTAPAPRQTAEQRPSVNPLRQLPKSQSPKSQSLEIQSPRTAEPVGRGEPAKSQFVGPRAAAKPVAPAVKPREVESSQRSKWSQHPSAAPLEWRDPFTDDPAASPNPLRSGNRHEALRPEFRASPSTRVDLRQLSAEIRGYNAALRSLQSAVMGLAANDTAALAAAEQELGQLDERRQFLDLYREGLSPIEQRALPDSPSADVVRELVRRKSEAISSLGPQSRRDERRAQQRLGQFGLESF